MNPFGWAFWLVVVGLIGYFVIMVNERSRLFFRRQWARIIGRDGVLFRLGRIIRSLFWYIVGALLFWPILAWLLIRLYQFGLPLALPPENDF